MGTTNLDSLNLGGNLNVTGNVVITGTLTAADIVGSIAVKSVAIGTADDGTTQTLTGPMVTGSGIFTVHVSAGGTAPSLTMPLATALIAANTGWAIGDSYILRVLNNNSGTATLVTNTGITTSGTLTIAAGGTADFAIAMTGAATVSMTRINQATIGAVTGTSAIVTGILTARSGTATPAAASSVAGLTMGSAGVGIYWGTGSPSTALTAPKGSLYLRTDGSTTNDRAYINTDGVTAWTAITTAA